MFQHWETMFTLTEEFSIFIYEKYARLLYILYAKHIFSTFPKFILRWWELLSLLFHWSYVGTSDKNCKIFVTVTKTKFSSLGLPFDIKVCQKHVKMPQILQNANRYSNRSSRQNELICLKGFSGKWKMTFWQPNKSKTCQNASNIQIFNTYYGRKMHKK